MGAREKAEEANANLSTHQEYGVPMKLQERLLPLREASNIDRPADIDPHALQ
jgi:hypothetical protein